MKIIFLCGSLEPGRDGVGDYTRRLACELIRQGHLAAAIAINDINTSSSIRGFQTFEEINLPVLRLQSVRLAKKRLQEIRNWINEFDPDWISLQFVPFAFHSKGFPFGLGTHLIKLYQGRRCHVMFHELWIGTGTSFNMKRLFASFLQKMLVNQLIHVLKPALIHTQLPEYYLKLRKLTYPVKCLPLFSNIRPVSNEHFVNKADTVTIGFFSQVECNKAVMAFLRELGENILQTNMKVEVLLIGGEPKKMEAFSKALEKVKNYKGRVSYTGFLKPKELSFALGSCTLGVTPVPRHALGKSGSVAAFIAHGIPVAAPNCNSKHLQEIGFFSKILTSSIMLDPNYHSFETSKIAAGGARREIQLAVITNKFLADIREF